MGRSFLISAISVYIFFACTSEPESGKNKPGRSLTEGKWRGTIASESRDIPFIFEVSSASDSVKIHLINGKERFTIDDVTIIGDSVHIPIAIFDAAIHARMTDGGLDGVYVKNYVANYRLPFSAIYNDSARFRSGEPPAIDYSGKWEVDFIEADGTDKAIGLFQQEGSYLTGTFATPTGDYRFLEGIVTGDTMKMSAFDGTHLYLFEGIVDENGRIDGSFWSGKAYFQKWTAVRNEAFELPDPTSFTFLNPGYEDFNISFPNADGKIISLKDEQFRDKPVIIQIMGSWCPNCMDESRFLASWYDLNKDRGVEILGLAFERKPEPDYASERVKVMKEKLGIHYEVLIAGTTTPESRAEALPMLNKVMSFPTTLFLDRNHKVRKIHTGFSGPGTGDMYDRYIEDFNIFMDKLLVE
ncbi:MAG: TlpA disulfide reductase family protein [Cyclobacteriaceae bacterium]|nr:TlpA disulfide reductase family protein [Cyclobacteriaceae bacterium]